MLKIYNIKEKEQYLKEILILSMKEWGEFPDNKDELNNKIDSKIKKIKNIWNNNNYCKLILLEDKELIGFISIFPNDCYEKPSLGPWYATMYVKEEYRGKGYSKILNKAILKEAKNRGFKKIYLKTTLKNYYEKFGAMYLEKLNNEESIYYFNL